jgi:diguanylate cyclase (GGDEF)-like protein/PAS domain S-box-containing protein
MREHSERERDFNAALYSAVLRVAIDGILLVDSQEKIISYNQRFVEIWGIPPELMASKSDAPVLKAVAGQVTDREAFVARIKELYADTDGNSRDEIPLRDGRTLDRYSAPVRLDNGTYVGRVWFFRDITEQKRAAAKIRDDASQFRGLVEQQIAGIFIITINGTLAYVNNGFASLCGHTPAEVIGTPFLDVVADKDKDRLRRSFAEQLQGSAAATQTLAALKRKDGTLVDVLTHAAVASYQGNPALIGIIVDITEQTRATQLLQASEERFRLLVEQAPDAIVLYDVDTDRFVSANKSATILLGRSREEILKAGLLQFFIPGPTDEHSIDVSFNEHNRRALAGAECVFERRFRKPNGSEGTCEVRLVRLPTISGRVLRGSLIDVTERKRAEIAVAYRDRVLHAVTLCVAELVTAPSLAARMPQALQIAAEALQVDRIMIFEQIAVPAPAIAVSMVHAWQAADIPAVGASGLTSIPPDSPELAAWLAPLLEGKPVVTKAATASGVIGTLMRQFHSQSSLLMPIAVAGKYWGHIGIDDCKAERQWTTIELDTLGTLSQVIGALIMREQSQISLQSSEERFRAVSDTAQDAIVMIDSAARVVYWNRAAESIFGYAASEAMGKSVLRWLAPVRYREKFAAAMPNFAATGQSSILGRTFELAAIRKDDIEFPIELSVASIRLGVQWHAVATIRDITERKRSVEQIRNTARHDNLTGLANRAVFVDTLQEAIAQAQRVGSSFAVLYLDLDHFKDVNDTLGHPVGDLLLQSLADRLRTSVRGTDIVARFGGDEFALIATNIHEPIDAGVLASTLLNAIGLPFSIQGNEIRSGASIGIAVYGLESASAEALLSHADVALYRAKAEGRGTYRFYTDAMDVDVRTRVTLGAELRDAIPAGQLFLMYQPEVNVDTGDFVGVEVLARWQHPTRGLLLPDVFIPIAEQSGLIVALGNWVLHEACRQMKEWIDAGIAPPLIAVNVSGLQFKTPFALENDIAAILTETGLQAPRLELELTESVLMAVSSEHNDTLLRLRKAGHRIAIDDFGTGYSSLEYLGRFPVNRIKIAQSFIVDLTTTIANHVIVKAAIGLAHELNLDVVVEGVETVEQLNLIRSWSCRKAQGHYFSKPLPARELSVLLRAGKILPARPIFAAVAAE